MAAPASTFPTWLTRRADGVVIAIKAQPRASRSEIVHVAGGELKVRICSAPVDGKANAEVLKVLSRALDVAPGALLVLRGETARQKLILVRGLDAATVCSRLSPASG